MKIFEIFKSNDLTRLFCNHLKKCVYKIQAKI